MKYRKVVFVLLISIFAITVKQSYLWSGEPSVLVKKVILNQYSFDEIENVYERRTKQWEAISPSINFEMISQGVMGEYWEKCLYDEKSEFVRLFTNHLKNTFVKMTNSLCVKEIISLKEKQFDGFAEVQTTLRTKSGKEISTDFCLLLDNGGWKICDLTIEGVSMVKNYHSQVASTLVRTSYEELLHMIKRKQDKRGHSILASDRSIE